jgi:hypothetical protein
MYYSSYQKLETNTRFFLALYTVTFYRSKLYNGQLPHFEISVKLRGFHTHIDLFAEKNLFRPYLVTFYFLTGRHKNKGKCPCYFYRTILLSIQIQLLDIENPYISKIDNP